MHRKKIKQKMKELGIGSFTKLAEIAQVRRRTVSDFLGKNEKGISPKNLEKIMIALQLCVADNKALPDQEQSETL